jgi:hypothetical protein
MNRMADSEPSRSTVKRLFALSGNRCAFPKCQAPLALNETLVGEVCHIKGKLPGAARYDPAQTPAERNTYENLILLCAPHHTVVDDDEESYTVERLRKMKMDHESRATPIAEKDADQVAAGYSTVATVGQSGGIAANNFTATNFTLNAAQATDSVSKRQLEALENLWDIILTLRKTFGTVLYVDTILLASEIAEHFKTGRYHQVMDAAREYADPQCVANKIISVAPDRERPFVSHRIYSIVFLLRALYGRAALLLQNSFIDREYNDWRLDPGTDQLLRGMLPAALSRASRKNLPADLQWQLIIWKLAFSPRLACKSNFAEVTPCPAG